MSVRLRSAKSDAEAQLHTGEPVAACPPAVFPSAFAALIPSPLTCMPCSSCVLYCTCTSTVLQSRGAPALNSSIRQMRGRVCRPVGKRLPFGLPTSVSLTPLSCERKMVLPEQAQLTVGKNGNVTEPLPITTAGCGKRRVSWDVLPL